MSTKTPDPSVGWLAARRLAWLALALPLLVLLCIAMHGWLAVGEGLVRDRAIGAAGPGQLTLTPSGQPPREGPGSHPAIDRRHTPRLPRRSAR